MDDRRNPYVILGVPYGASRGEARRAAARRTRELRQRAEAPYSTEDVTWALHQVEQVIDDPTRPWRSSACLPPQESSTLRPATGLFHPPAVPLPRRSGPLTDEEFEAIRHAAVAAVSRNVIIALGSHVRCWPPEHDEGSS